VMRSAFFPVNCSNLCTITSAYNGSSSIRNALNLLGRQVRGYVDWNLGKAEFLRGLPAGMADNDHAGGIDNDGLAPAEFLQAGRDRVDGAVIDPRVAVVGDDPFDRPEVDLHVGSGSPGWVSRWPTSC
jgi:hypothetical protein